MLAHRDPGEAVDLERADDALAIVAVDPRGEVGVDRGEAVVEVGGAVGVGQGVELGPDRGVGGRAVEQAEQQRAHVEPGAAADHDRAAARVGVGDRGVGELDEAGRGHLLVGADDVEQVVADGGALGGGRLAGADVHARVDLLRVGGHDLGAGGAGQRERQRVLPAPVGPTITTSLGTPRM